MLRWALGFLVLALIAGFLGFGGVAATSAGIAKTLFVLFLIIAAVYLVVAVTLVLVLRLMARRFEASDDHHDDRGGPYSPRPRPGADDATPAGVGA